jgi:predicted ATPase with chaperone activity
MIESGNEYSFDVPMDLESTGLSEEFVRNLLLKSIGKFRPTVKELMNMTGLSQSIVEPLLMKLEDEKLISFEGSSGMTAYLSTSILSKGREYLKEIMTVDNYVGIAPIAYKDYKEIMPKLTEGRYPLSISMENISNALSDLIVNEHTKRTLRVAMSVGRGIIVYGPAGNGKTTVSSKLSQLLPPIIIPRTIEYGGNVIIIFDSNFHVPLPDDEQPKDRRWVKVEAPFIVTGPELTTENLFAPYDSERGAYMAQPQVKAHGGVFLIDDLGRQKESHHIILNRLIFPMENKKDMIYISGIPIEVFTDFVPILSTNISIAIFDEAHLRRAPFHVYLGPPDLKESSELLLNFLNDKGVEAPPEVKTEIENVFKLRSEGGMGLKPSFAVLITLVELIHLMTNQNNTKTLDKQTLFDAIDNNIVLALQKQDVVLHKLDDKFKNEISSFELTVQGKQNDIDHALKSINGLRSHTVLNGHVLIDLVEGTSAVEAVEAFEADGVNVQDIKPIGKTRIPMVDEERLGK